ncbi:MAG: hypothetical protein HEP71_10895 [Roseivirga sp.]|nr:hypothetical protein [Roseivirga sp.]
MSSTHPLEYYKTELADIPYMAYEGSNAYFIPAEAINKRVVERVLEAFRPQDEIRFFDNNHFQISDPGAHVTVHKFKDSFVYSLANYGWSSRGQTITDFHLIRYILKSLPELKELCIYPLNVDITRERTHFYHEKQLTLVETYLSVSLYEVNGSYLLRDIFYSDEYFNVLLNQIQTTAYENRAAGLPKIIRELLNEPLELVDNHIIIK